MYIPSSTITAAVLSTFLNWMTGAPVILDTTEPPVTAPNSQQYLAEQSIFPLQFRPVIIWHGLGDDYNSSSINRTVSVIKESHPDIYVHPVYIDLDPLEDKKLTFFGDANKQIEIVCKQLKEIPQLSRGFDVIGFSQGGLLLRALVERCPGLRVNNLITFGSPHMGVSDISICEDPEDWFCKKKNEVLKSQIWLDSVQKSILPALYFRDTTPNQYEKYVFHSYFLGDVNNELADHVNSTYSRNLNGINKLVMIKFNKDTTLIPKESAWFEEIDPDTGDVINFDKTTLYTQNLIGLRDLHFAGKLEFIDIDEDHMRIPQEFLVMIVQRFIGGIVF